LWYENLCVQIACISAAVCLWQNYFTQSCLETIMYSLYTSLILWYYMNTVWKFLKAQATTTTFDFMEIRHERFIRHFLVSSLHLIWRYFLFLSYCRDYLVVFIRIATLKGGCLCLQNGVDWKNIPHVLSLNETDTGCKENCIFTVNF